MIFQSQKNNEKLIKLLKESSSDFKFDPNRVKYHLFSSIDLAHQKPTVSHFRLRRVFQYSASFAILVILISSAFAFASNARPGDKLFALNKAGEQLILKLPFSEEQNAKFQEHIVTSRLEALDDVKLETKKIETLKESDETLSSAVNAITENKKKLEASGKKDQAQKLELILDKIQIMAQKREAAIKEIEEKTTDEKIKNEIEKHLRQIKDSRKKAQLEIKRYQQNREED